MPPSATIGIANSIFMNYYIYVCNIFFIIILLLYYYYTIIILLKLK